MSQDFSLSRYRNVCSSLLAGVGSAALPLYIDGGTNHFTQKRLLRQRTAIRLQSSKRQVWGAAEMGVIKEVNLQASHEAWWRFQYRGGGHPLPDGISVLTVYDGSQWWNFDCSCEGNNWFCIKGSEWNRFVRKNAKAMITLYSKEEGDDYHRIRVR